MIKIFNFLSIFIVNFKKLYILEDNLDSYMPISKKSDMSKRLSSLPLTAKKVFMKAYTSAVKTQSEDESFKAAWKAVKSVYTRQGDTWVRKSSVKLKSVVARSGWFGKRYYFDAAIASDIEAEDGLIATSDFLQKVSNDKNKIDFNGDLEHFKLDGNMAYNGLFKLIKQDYNSGKLYGRFMVDKTHPKYNWFIKNYANKQIGVSAEFHNPTRVGKKIIDCERLGWTITSNPLDPNAMAM